MITVDNPSHPFYTCKSSSKLGGFANSLSGATHDTTGFP